jgi:hypothetical protein
MVAVKVLHLIAKQQIADLVHADGLAARKRAIPQLRGGYGIDQFGFGFRWFPRQDTPPLCCCCNANLGQFRRTGIVYCEPVRAGRLRLVCGVENCEFCLPKPFAGAIP